MNTLPYAAPVAKKKKQTSFWDDNNKLLGAGLGAGLTGAALYGAGRAFLNDNEEGAVKNFINAADNQWTQPDVDLRDVARGYTELGSRFAQVKPFGVNVTSVMRGFRKAFSGSGDYPWVDPHPEMRPAIADDGKHIMTPVHDAQGNVVMNPGSAAHYDAFRQNPLHAYIQYLNELHDTFHTEHYNDLVGQQGVKLDGNQLQKNVINNWGGQEALANGHVADMISEGTRHSPAALNTIRHIHNETQPAINPDVGISQHSAITSTGTAPAHLYGSGNAVGDKAYYPAPSVPGFHSIIRNYANNLAQQNFAGRNIDQLNPAESQQILDKLDGYLKKVDPDVWRQKQWADATLGMEARDAAPQYAMLGKMGLALKHFATTLGMPLGIAGAGLLGKYLWNKIQKKQEDKTAAELAHNGALRVPKSMIRHALAGNIHKPARNRVMPHLSGRKVRSSWVGASSPIVKAAALFPQDGKPSSKKKKDYGWAIPALGGLAGVAGTYGLYHLMNGAKPPTPAPTATPTSTQPSPTAKTQAALEDIEPDHLTTIPAEAQTAMETEQPAVTNAVETQTLPRVHPDNNLINSSAHKLVNYDINSMLINKALGTKLPSLNQAVNSVASKVTPLKAPLNVVPWVAEAGNWDSDPARQNLSSVIKDQRVMPTASDMPTAQDLKFWNRMPNASQFLSHPLTSLGQTAKAVTYPLFKPLQKPLSNSAFMSGLTGNPAWMVAREAMDTIGATRMAAQQGGGWSPNKLAQGFGNIIKDNARNSYANGVTTKDPITMFGSVADTALHAPKSIPQGLKLYANNKADEFRQNFNYNPQQSQVPWWAADVPYISNVNKVLSNPVGAVTSGIQDIRAVPSKQPNPDTYYMGMSN